MNIIDRLYDAGFSSINAGFAKFTIEIKPTVTVDGHKCSGATDFSTYKITVDKPSANSGSTEVVLHELLHVAAAMCGIDDFREDKKRKQLEFDNELIVTQMARGLLMLEALNPGLMKVLFESE